MAVSDLFPRKAVGRKTRRQTLHERLDYEQKEEKTRGGMFITSYMCSPETAAEEFEMDKLIYETVTGRKLPKEKDIIAYRIIQSFKPGEITPEDANRLGYELAMKFTKGKHQFVVSTHTDKEHVHNHIEFNSVNLECSGKFNNFKNSSFALRKLNDEICREYGYSVIENPKGRGQRYQEKAAAKRGRSFKEKIRRCIDRVLPGSRDFEEFLERMRAEGYEVKRRGKSLEFRAPGQERFTRSYRLGEEYAEEALRKRIEEIYLESTGKIKGQEEKGNAEEHGNTERKETPGRNGNPVKGKKQAGKKELQLLVDIQAKIQAGKGKGYERWAQVFNIKEAAKTLNFLTEKGITDYEEIAERAEKAGERFDALSVKIKQLEGRMAKTADLKMQIINYSKTREVYKEYRKARNKKEFYAAHSEEIKKHEAAKAAFDKLNGKPIPKVAELTKEYGALLEEKKACYEEYKKARQEMIEYQTAKQNVDRILKAELPEQENKKQKETRR